MICSIDKIMDMLDWHQPEEVQAEGRELAREVRCINVFLQPGHKGHNKNVWDNCALILAERTDEELKPSHWILFSFRGTPANQNDKGESISQGKWIRL